MLKLKKCAKVIIKVIVGKCAKKMGNMRKSPRKCERERERV